MKVAAVLAIAIMVVLIIVSSIYVAGKVLQSSQRSTTGRDTDLSANASSKDSSLSENVEPAPSQPSKSIEDVPLERPAPANGVVSSASSPTIVDNQEGLKSVENETQTASVTPPDGRIYTGGDEPYAYLPTCLQKERPLPIVPLGSND